SLSNDSNEYDKKFILPLGTHIVYFFINSKKHYVVNMIGVRPQIDKPFLKRMFSKYHNKTQNLNANDISNCPIIIKKLEDVTRNLNKSFDHDEDDNKCGRVGFFKPQLEIVPDQYIELKLEIETRKVWSGYIDFRIDDKMEGRKGVHHRCVIVVQREGDKNGQNKAVTEQEAF
ncbi:hypothetical protein ACFLUS_05895, partial [Chloroflexota bacterium]